jgi:hypothetical protein
VPTVNKVEYLSSVSNSDTINSALQKMNAEGFKLMQVVHLGATLLLFFEGETTGRPVRVT